MLDPIHIIELGDGLSGSRCAATLRSLGASVTKLTLGASGSAPHARREGLLRSLLDLGKTVRAGAAQELSAPLDADIVLCDRSVDDILVQELSAYASHVKANNRKVWVTITPFGMSGPYAGYRGSELVASAAGGLSATIAPKGGGRPSMLPGSQAFLIAGQVAALAALHGLDLYRRRGEPVHIEVSAQEAVAMIGALPECAHAIYACPGRAGSGRYVAPSGLFPCSDGLVRIVATDNHQWAGMVRAMGSPAWTRGLEERQARADHAERINQAVGEWTRERTIAGCAATLQEHGVPATPLNGPLDLLASPQFAARAFMQPARLRELETRIPGRPFTWSENGAASARDNGLVGLRVAEFAHVLAGPIAGSLLGAVGANVVRFEDRARLDLYRRTGPFAAGKPGVERGAYFTVANHTKRSVAVDVESNPGVAWALAAQSDVVLENFGAKKMKQLGVAAERLVAQKPELLFVSLSGFGQSGPLASYRAYANNVHAYGGLSYLTRNIEGELVDIGTVLADPLSALCTATVIAAWALGSKQRGGVVDLSMAEVVAGQLAEFIAEAGAGRAQQDEYGCDRYPHAPHGIFPCTDGRWIAIGVQSDQEWRALRDALGAPKSLAGTPWERAEGRWEERRAIEQALAALTCEENASELFQRLQRAGVRACPVWTGAELVQDAHLEARGFFPAIEHPDPEITAPRLVGLGWRVVGEGPVPLRPPPRLGEYPLIEESA